LKEKAKDDLEIVIVSFEKEGFHRGEVGAASREFLQITTEK
jgi:hypothetical protein